MRTIVRIIIMLLLVPALSVRAQGREPEADSLRVSLLTCSPGREVYELYGHTALRVVNRNKPDYDWVFNFGWFSFNKPGFVWRFVLGQTDYSMGVEPLDKFVMSYAYRGRGIDEQVLNLTPAEANAVLRSLEDMARQEDWTYRYSYLYDNCTTRAVLTVVAQAVEACGEQVAWPQEEDGLRTFRSMIHRDAATSPWYSFGQDLMLGCEADRPIPVVRQLFLPLYAKRFVSMATLGSADSKRALVKETYPILMPLPAQKSAADAFTPLVVAAILLLLAAMLTWYDRKAGWRYVGAEVFDCVFMAVQGLAGCVIFVLFFFSEHPSVNTNWLILVLNPLPLLFLPFRIWLYKTRRRSIYNIVAAILALLIILIGACQIQDFPPAIYVLALILLLRGAATAASLRGGKSLNKALQ